jgi:NAD(P)-dependent dehydrogenase (short-subunit alcohol dehydrogenase family)
MTFAVNVLAPHLLTHLLSTELRGRLVWLGSGVAGSGHPQPATLGRDTDPWRAYVESKACDVALALAWDRRLPDVTSAAVDPGWVKTKLASPGAQATSAPPPTPSPFAAHPPTWPRRLTGRTGRRRRSQDGYGIPRCRMRSLRPVIDWWVSAKPRTRRMGPSRAVRGSGVGEFPVIARLTHQRRGCCSGPSCRSAYGQVWVTSCPWAQPLRLGSWNRRICLT